jgi:hypothetical protein
MYDNLISRKIIEVILMKSGISLSTIKEMSEIEVMEYTTILGAMNEIEVEKMEQSRRY